MFKLPTRSEIYAEVKYWLKSKPSQSQELDELDKRRLADDWVQDLEKYPLEIIREAWSLYRVENKFAPSIGDMTKYLERATREKFGLFRTLGGLAGHALEYIKQGRIEVLREKIPQEKIVNLFKPRAVK